MSEETTKMENREARDQNAMNRTVPQYARLFFDHLYSEYLSLKPSITDYSLLNLLEEIQQRRLKHELTWSDIYTFDLTLMEFRPAENLIRKAFDARAKYRSVAGQKEYDEYLASKPLDLGAIQLEQGADPPKPNVLIERELRADIRYLLSKFYLYYALLPMREGLRDRMTKRAVVMTAVVVVVIGLALIANITVSLRVPAFNEFSAVFITVLTVMLAGIVGGCISMLQRIQSTPSDGDALFNLAALTSGWRGIMLAPVYGGIFAFFLFVMFAGGVLNGAVFPTIVTPSKLQSTSATSAANVPCAPMPTPSPSQVQTATTQELPQVKTTNTETPTQGQSPESPTPAPSPSPPSVEARSAVLKIEEFLKETGPASGVSYALLIVWSFLAGFAERLVPDTLNRLVQKNINTQGGSG
jgi:hypothetical protein